MVTPNWSDETDAPAGASGLADIDQHRPATRGVGASAPAADAFMVTPEAHPAMVARRIGRAPAVVAPVTALLMPVIASPAAMPTVAAAMKVPVFPAVFAAATVDLVMLPPMLRAGGRGDRRSATAKHGNSKKYHKISSHHDPILRPRYLWLIYFITASAGSFSR
jgi:hypothetical protein